MTKEELGILRRAYAHQMVALTGAQDSELERAFAAVPREVFLGPGPWMFRGFNVAPCRLTELDPVLVYQDVWLRSMKRMASITAARPCMP